MTRPPAAAAVASRRRARARVHPQHALLLVLALVAIVQLVLSARSSAAAEPAPAPASALLEVSSSSSSSSSSSAYTLSNGTLSIQKNKKVKACQPLPIHKPAHKVCKHVQQHCALDGHIDYLASYFCAGVPSNGHRSPLAADKIGLVRGTVLAAILAWLLFLFSSVGLTASDFFSPNLSTLASRLHLSESTAGVSLLAFGNGSPDVFSTFAAMRSGSGSLAIGELIGAASFITAVVAAAMMLVQPFRVKPYPFLRDVGFFTVAIALALFVLLDGTLHLSESLTLVALYVAYAALVIVGGWWQERRRQRRLAERAGLYGAKETRPSIIEAGLHFPSEEEEETDANERTPLHASDTAHATTPSQEPAPASRNPNLKLQIPQTPLQRKPSLNRFLAPPQTGGASAHVPVSASIHSASSSPLASPIFAPPSSSGASAVRSPSALIRSEYDPDADDEGEDSAGGALTTASLGYATEADPFDRALALGHAGSGETGLGIGSALAAATAVGAPGILTASKSNATVPVAAPGSTSAFAFPPLPATGGTAATMPVPGPSASAGATPAHAATTGLAPHTTPVTPGPGGIRPGYYLPRHSLLGAIEFRDVVRSLQAESAAALLASSSSTANISGGGGAARTPGGYYADDSGADSYDSDEGLDSERHTSDDAGMGAVGMRRSGSQPVQRRPNSLFGSLGLGLSSSGAISDHLGTGREPASRSGSVSRKGKGKNRGLLSSLGFGGGGGSADDDEDLDDGSLARARHSSMVGPDLLGARKTPGTHRRARGSSLSVAPSESNPELASTKAGPMSAHPTPGRRVSQRFAAGPAPGARHLRTQSTSVGPGAVRPLLSGGEQPTPVSAARDRGWELFYSRGLELESDWERLASPAGAVGSAAATNREAVRQHLLSAHPHPSAHHHHHRHHRANSQNHHHHRRRSQNRSGEQDLSGSVLVDGQQLQPQHHHHRRAHSVHPAIEGATASARSAHAPPSPSTEGLLGTDNVPGVKGMGRSASTVVPEQAAALADKTESENMAKFTFGAGTSSGTGEGARKEELDPSPLHTPGGHRARSPEPAAKRTDTLPRLAIPTSSTGRSLAVRAQAAGTSSTGALVDVGDEAEVRSNRSVPSIMIDDEGSRKRVAAQKKRVAPPQDEEEDEDSTQRTPRPGDGFSRRGPRSRTLSASTTLTADEEEETRGLRLRTTSNGSYAHPRPALYGIEEGGTTHGAGSHVRGQKHRAISGLRRFKRSVAHGWDHLLYDYIEPIAHALFPSLRHFGSKSWIGIIVSVLSVPAIFVLKLTLPVVVDEEEEEQAAAQLEEEEEEEREAAKVGAGAGMVRSASVGSRRSLLRGPVRLEGDERLLVAHTVIDSPQPLSASPSTPRPFDANAQVAEGLKALQTDPSASLSGSVTVLGQSSTSKHIHRHLNEDNSEGDEDGSESCDSCDDAEAAENALAFYDREERKRRATAARFLALTQVSLGPTFCTWAILSPKTFSLRDPGMRTVLRVFAVGTALALLCALCIALGARRVLARHPSVRRTISLVRCLGGFVVSVMFIMTIVDEVVSILQAIGIIMGLSDAILGLTIFAMGNSLGDLVANVTIARMGHPVMAISACFAGPLLNILLGIGLSGTYILTSHDRGGPEAPTKLILDFSPTLLVSCIGLLVILIGILIAVPLNGFYLDRKLGSVLIITYGIIMAINVLTEIFVDKD
ncbi:hypothetical protein OC835_000698 [Tilletia horrida]|nr:hypothetical protein OC835_000698 [Tilletia horrida]